MARTESPTEEEAPVSRQEVIHEAARLAASQMFGWESEDIVTPPTPKAEEEEPAQVQPLAPAPRLEPGEVDQAAERLATFDPADAKQVEDRLARAPDEARYDSKVVGHLQRTIGSGETDADGRPLFSEEERRAAAKQLEQIGDAAIDEYRLASMKERGDLAATFNSQISEEISAGDQEMRFLADELDRPGLSARERATKQEQYTALVRRVPRLRQELKIRAAEAEAEVALQQRIAVEARQCLIDEKVAVWHRAEGRLSPEQMARGETPPRRLSPPKIAQLRWESEQEPAEAAVQERAEAMLEKARRDRLRARALAFSSSKAANAGRQVFELYGDPFMPNTVETAPWVAGVQGMPPWAAGDDLDG